MLVDYVVDVDELLARGARWLRTYRAHGRGGDPLDAPGTQDITADVVREQLARRRARRRASRSSTTERRPTGCADLGIDELVAAGRQRVGGTARPAATSTRSPGAAASAKAAALTDPAGLGAHRVVTLAKPTQTAPTQHR